MEKRFSIIASFISSSHHQEFDRLQHEGEGLRDLGNQRVGIHRKGCPMKDLEAHLVMSAYISHT